MVEATSCQRKRVVQSQSNHDFWQKEYLEQPANLQSVLNDDGDLRVHEHDRDHDLPTPPPAEG